MIREVWEGENKQLSFTRVLLTPPIAVLTIGLLFAIVKGDGSFVLSIVGGITALLIPKVAQSFAEKNN